MKHLLNNQMLESDYLSTQQKDVLTIEVSSHKQESEIENGNLQDYLEIYGELDDIS